MSFNIQRVPFLFSSLVATALLLAIGSPNNYAAVQPIDRVAAVVNDGIIMKSEVDKRMAEIRRNVARKDATLPPDDVLLREVMEQLILESLQLQIGERAGVRIDDNTLNQYLQRLAAQNGMSLLQFQQALARDGVSYQDMREQVRREMITQRVREGRVGSRIQITEQEVQNYVDSEAGKEDLQARYKLAHILIKVPEEATDSQVSALEQQARDIFQQALAGEDFSELAKRHSNAANAARGGVMAMRKESRLPSIFAEIAPGLDTGDVSEPFRSANGFHILKLLDKRGGDRIMIEQLKVRHILIKPSEIRTDEQAKQLVTDLKARIAAGEDFATLATEFSDDTGTLSEGGSLGWMNPVDLVPEFRKTMLASELNVVTDPVRTQFGWHILEVLDRRQHNISADVRKRMAQDTIYKRKFAEELELWLQEERTDAYVDIKLY